MTHWDVEQQLLVHIAHKVRGTGVQLLLLEYTLERMVAVLVQAVDLERVEQLEEGRLVVRGRNGKVNRVASRR